MNPQLRCLLGVTTLLLGLQVSAQTLDIYFIDVEGGQATLVVTPAGQSFLVDTGYPGDGGPRATAGDPTKARDANRILAAARDAGIRQIDYLMITHFHGDHDGGAVELSQLLPIKTYVDHGEPSPDVDRTVPGSRGYFDAYAKVRAQAAHLEPKPGERLRLKGVDVTIVSSAQSTLARPLKGAGDNNPACGASGLPAQEPNENPRSTGIVLQFGKFRFLDLGDLSGAPLFALACPRNLIGPVDAYLVTHHGGVDAGDPATMAAFSPRVAIMNNGVSKGGAPQTFQALRQSNDVGDVWQLHRSRAAGDANYPDDRIANLDESTAHWLKLSASRDGSFELVNGRTGVATRYSAVSKHSTAEGH